MHDAMARCRSEYSAAREYVALMQQRTASQQAGGALGLAWQGQHRAFLCEGAERA